MKELVKLNEVENKPKNVEEAIKAGWKTAKEMYTTCETSRQTWENFVADIRKTISQKPNSGYRIDPTTEKCITGAHNTKYYHPKVEEAFQTWLRRNAINAGGQRTEGSIIKQEIHDIVDNSVYKYSKEDICSICNVDEKTFRRFFEEVRLDGTVQPKVISEQDFISVGSSHKKLYTETVLQKFQLWLMKNQANQGRSSQVIKQAVHNSVENNEYKYTKEDICKICNVGHAAFERFAPSSISEQDFISVGSSHKKLYTETVLQKFQLWLMKNQANQGRSSQVIKQATKDNLELGVLANVALTNREAWEQFKALGDAKLEAEEKLKLEQQQNQKLQLENYQLNEENNYLKKLNDFNTTQLGYYTKKYHSWYDDYENY